MKFFPLLVIVYVLYTFTLVQSQLLGGVTHVIDAISDKTGVSNPAQASSPAVGSPSSNAPPAAEPSHQTTVAPAPSSSSNPSPATQAPTPVISNDPSPKPPVTTEAPAPAPAPSPVTTTTAAAPPVNNPSRTPNTPATPDPRSSSPGTPYKKKGDYTGVPSTSDSASDTTDFTTTSINGVPTVIQVPKSAANSTNSGGSKTGIIVGAVIGGIIGVALIGGCLTWFNRRGGCARRQKRSHDFEDFGLADTDFPHQQQQQQQQMVPPQVPQMQTMNSASPTIPRMNDPMYNNETNSYYQPQIVDDYNSQGYYYPSPQQPHQQQQQQAYYDNTGYPYEHQNSYSDPAYPVDHYKPDQPNAKPHQYI